MVGKKVFIAGVADDQGFGWQIAKAMAEAGAEISLGVWVPALKIFESSLRRCASGAPGSEPTRQR